MSRQTLAGKIANSLLSQQGLGIIWKLHMDAALLYRVGNGVAAASFLEIADAAEQAWQRRCEVASRSRIGPIRLEQRHERDPDHHEGATRDPAQTGRMLIEPEQAKMVGDHGRDRRGRHEQADIDRGAKPGRRQRLG